MVQHEWRCECGEIVDAIGLMSLSYAVQTHEAVKHNIKRSVMTESDLAASPRYLGARQAYTRTSYTQPNALCSGPNRPTMQEHIWLRDQKILWDGDTRHPEELAERYKRLAA